MRKATARIAFVLAAVLTVLLTAGVGMAADGATISVSATIISKNQCKFNSASTTLDFGNLDPTNPVDVNVSTSITFVCRGSAPIATFVITDDDGMHETAVDANRMQHGALPAEYLPYSFSYNPATASVPKNVDQTLIIDGTVLGADYQTAIPGVYSDSVVLSILP